MIDIKVMGEVPSYARQGDAGADLRATEDMTIYPGERKLVPTGVYMALPEGYVGLIHPRSGLAFNYGITVLNTPGTIDSGYRGEIKVLLINLGHFDRPFEIKAGDRIAQLVIQKYETAQFHLVDSLDETDRGEGGFGSTGKS